MVFPERHDHELRDLALLLELLEFFDKDIGLFSITHRTGALGSADPNPLRTSMPDQALRACNFLLWSSLTGSRIYVLAVRSIAKTFAAAGVPDISTFRVGDGI